MIDALVANEQPHPSGADGGIERGRDEVAQKGIRTLSLRLMVTGRPIVPLLYYPVHDVTRPDV